MISSNQLTNSSSFDTVNVPQIGKMYFFQYDPKLKNKLPYYDRYPLIFCVRPLKDGFHGLNLHYLSYKYRLIFYRNLIEKVSKDKQIPEESDKQTSLTMNIIVYIKRLFESLRRVLSDKNEQENEEAQLVLSYRILKNYTGFRYFKPCFKRYLYSQITSNIVEIPSDKWEEYLISPLESFAKEQKEKVWEDSLSKFR